MTRDKKGLRRVNGSDGGPGPRELVDQRLAQKQEEENNLCLNILMQTMAHDFIWGLNGADYPHFHGFSPLQYPAKSGYRRWYRKRYPNHFTWTSPV